MSERPAGVNPRERSGDRGVPASERPPAREARSCETSPKPTAEAGVGGAAGAKPPGSMIDVHNHFYPPEYLDALTRVGSSIRVTYDADGNPLLHYPGDYNILVPGHRDIVYRRGVLESLGVDTQVISFTTPLNTSFDAASVVSKRKPFNGMSQ